MIEELPGLSQVISLLVGLTKRSALAVKLPALIWVGAARVPEPPVPSKVQLTAVTIGEPGAPWKPWSQFQNWPAVVANLSLVKLTVTLPSTLTA